MRCKLAIARNKVEPWDKIKIAITFFYSVAETGFHRYEQLNKQSSYKVNNYTANLLDTKKYLQMG